MAFPFNYFRILLKELENQIEELERQIHIEKSKTTIQKSPDKNQGFFLFTFYSKLPQYIQNKKNQICLTFILCLNIIFI